MPSDRPDAPTLRAYRNRSEPIDRFQVLGDRNSGTNFLTGLMLANFPELFDTAELGWKHGFIDRRLVDRTGLLTLVVYRHVAPWLRSVHRRPWEISRSVSDLPFDRFIRAEWRPAWVTDLPDGSVREEPIQGDMYPHTTRRFENVLRMRSVKIAYWEELARLPGQVAFARYEDANRDPNGFVTQLARAFDIAEPAPFRPVRHYKGRGERRYGPRSYEPLSDTDAAFLEQELDIDQETRIGYDVRTPPRSDGLARFDPRRLRGAVRRFRDVLDRAN